MCFEWDEEKRRANVDKLGLDFADAWALFDAPMLAALNIREDYGEDRWVGFLKNFIVVVVYAESGADTVRIISLRKALKHERARFEEALRDGLGESQ